MVAGEGFGLRKNGWSFGGLTEEEADALTGFDGGAGLEAVVTDAAKSFGQDVLEPAADKFKWMEF